MTSQTKLNILKHWVKPASISTMLARWVLDLLPENEEKRRALIKAAALRGTTMGAIVTMGQVSYVQHKAEIVAFGLRSRGAAYAFHEFGRECCMVSKAAIIRTAIMVGLELPRVEVGIMSCTRVERFTEQEANRVINEAWERFPEEKL